MAQSEHLLKQIRENIDTLRKSYERQIRLSRTVDQPHHKAGIIRVFNNCWDRYNNYVASVTDWCREKGLRISTNSKLSPLFERITGPEIEREQFKRKPPSQFKEAA